MDFHTMTRRQLQALCKQNRIPANITNVAMADALEALRAEGSLENAEEVLQATPLVPSSRKASLRRQAPASAVNFEASIEPREQPASPLPRARRVTVNASEIRRLAVEGEENEKEEVEKEAVGEATMKPPPRSSRRASKKTEIEAKEEEESIDAMKTPAPLTGRRTAARRLAKTPVAVEHSATSTLRRSSRIRAKTEQSALKMGSSFQEVEPEQGIEISNALVKEDDNGDKDCDLAVVVSDVPQNSLEEAVMAPEAKELSSALVEEDDNGDKDCDLAVVDSDVPQNSVKEAVIAKEFAAIAVVSEEEPLDKGEDEVEVDDHCEKGCTLMDDLEEDRITPNTEEVGVAKDELIDMPTEEAPEADVKELQLHLFPKNDEEKPMDMITEKDDEIAPEDEEFTDVKELGSMIKHHEGDDTKDDSEINEDGGIHGDQHQIVESGENVDNEDEVIQEKSDFEGSPVQGLITSLENLELTKDLHLDDLAPKYDETKHAADEHTEEINEDFQLEDLAPEDDETKHEIPDATVDSFIQNQTSDIPDCHSEVETMSSDLAPKIDEDFHLEDLALEDDETKHEIPGATVDSFIQNQASDLEAKTTGEVDTKCELSGADKENEKQNVQENLELMSLRQLKKIYKEKISSNVVDKVETKRQALNDVNQNIVS